MPNIQSDSAQASSRKGRNLSPAKNRSHSWHRTRSRSRTRGDTKSTQRAQSGDGLEHLVRGILEYALQLFVNASGKQSFEGLDGPEIGQPETYSQKHSSHQQQRPDGKSQSDTSMNEIARLVLSQVVKYGIGRYIKSRKKQPRMSGTSRHVRRRPARRDKSPEPAEHADAPPDRATPARQSQDSRPRNEGETFPRQQPALLSQYLARPLLPSRYHEPAAPPSSPRGLLPVRPVRAHPQQSCHSEQDVWPKLWCLPAHSLPSPPTYRPAQPRESVGDTSQNSPHLFIAALEDLLFQLRATDDLVYRTLHRPSIEEAHDGCNSRRAVLTHAADLHRAIVRASADTREVRDMMDAFLPVRKI